MTGAENNGLWEKGEENLEVVPLAEVSRLASRFFPTCQELTTAVARWTRLRARSSTKASKTPVDLVAFKFLMRRQVEDACGGYWYGF